MPKRLAVISLLVILISSNFSWLFTYTGFELNQTYIAQNLCINRNKPELHCNGKCYLMKKFKQAEEKEKTHDKQVQRNLFQNGNLISLNADIKFHNCLLQIISTPYRPLKPIIFSGSVFHPPKLALSPIYSA